MKSRICFTTYRRSPERGCVVLDQPQHAASGTRLQLIANRSVWTPQAASRAPRAATGRGRHSRAPGSVFARLVLLGALATLLYSSTFADTVRVTSLNLEGLTNSTALADSAQIIKRLAPDVLLVQGARDWKQCNDLAEALRPENYLVCGCSSFSAEAGAGQVAILAKSKAFFSWAQAWGQGATSPGGGFIFAALPAKNHRLGFFSAAAGQAVSTAMLQPMLEQARTAAAWEANRVESMVAGFGSRLAAPAVQSAAGATANALGDAGYADAFALIPAKLVGTDRLLVQNTLFPANPTLSQIPNSSHVALTCDLELEPAKIAAAWTQRAAESERLTAEKLKEQLAAEEAAREARAAQLASVSEQARLRTWLLWGGIGGAFLVMICALLARRILGARHSAAVMLPEHAGHTLSYTVVVDTPAAAGALSQASTVETTRNSWQQRALMAEAKAAQANYILRNNLSGGLAAWLKQKFITRLITDRDQMLKTQEDAAFHALNVDQRLARVEEQIQRQTEAYQQKIDALTQELQAAREENRELIRSRIAQVKLEMDSVRSRMLAAAREHNE